MIYYFGVVKIRENKWAETKGHLIIGYLIIMTTSVPPLKIGGGVVYNN